MAGNTGTGKVCMMGVLTGQRERERETVLEVSQQANWRFIDDEQGRRSSFSTVWVCGAVLENKVQSAAAIEGNERQWPRWCQNNSGVGNGSKSEKQENGWMRSRF